MEKQGRVLGMNDVKQVKVLGTRGYEESGEGSSNERCEERGKVL